MTMGKHLLIAGLLAALLGGTPAEAANPRKPPQNPAGNGPVGPAGQGQQGPVSADQLLAGKYVGVVQAVPGDNRTLTINMEYQKVEINQVALQRLNANAQLQYQQVLRLQQQMMRPGRGTNVAGTMQQLQRAIAQLQAMQGAGGQGVAKATPASAEIEFPLTADVKIRVQEPAEEIDDKGNVKKYTPTELQAMKGKYPNLPGYPSTLDKVEKDQKVQLTLVKVSKSTAPPQPKDVDPDGPPEKGKAPAAAEHKMQVSVVLILNGKTAPPAGGKKR
jgi:hypothetical protein